MDYLELVILLLLALAYTYYWGRKYVHIHNNSIKLMATCLKTVSTKAAIQRQKGLFDFKYNNARCKVIEKNYYSDPKLKARDKVYIFYNQKDNEVVSDSALKYITKHMKYGIIATAVVILIMILIYLNSPIYLNLFG